MSTFNSPFNMTEKPIFAEKPAVETSFEAHDKEYRAENKIEQERAIHKKFTDENLQDKDDVPLGKVLRAYPTVEYAVDVGSGTGWASAYLSDKMKKVWAIEPSETAISMAKTFYGDKDNIEWTNGFAEQELGNLKLPNEPILFNFLCVLSHLPDDLAGTICREVDRISPKGSVISLSECWGAEHHEHLWHVRTKEWWQSHFPDWDLTFVPRITQDREDRFKGIWGQKL